MNVDVFTIDGAVANYTGCALTFDTSVLQVVEDGVTHTFPLTNVIQFSFIESVPK